MQILFYHLPNKITTWAVKVIPTVLVRACQFHKRAKVREEFLQKFISNFLHHPFPSPQYCNGDWELVGYVRLAWLVDCLANFSPTLDNIKSNNRRPPSMYLIRNIIVLWDFQNCKVSTIDTVLLLVRKPTKYINLL